MGIIWFDDIVEKLLRKHNVNQNEVNEVLYNKPHFRFVEKGIRNEENVYVAMGQTTRGRYLIIFFIYKYKWPYPDSFGSGYDKI